MGNDSNEADVLAILETLKFYVYSFHDLLGVESYSSNIITWVSRKGITCLWKFHYLLNEIRSLSSLMQVNFKHIKHSANNLADSLAKKGTERDIPLLLCKVCWFFVAFFKGFGTRLLYFPLLVWLLFYLVLF